MKKMLLFIALISILVICYFYSYTQEDFTEYKRCDEKPVTGIMKTILNKFNIKKTDDNYDLYIPCGYNGVEKELKNLTLNDPQGKKIFGIDGCDSIVSKNRLWLSLRACFGIETASKIMPLSAVLSDKKDMAQFKKKL